ncbi:MAG: hypothetical protein DIZ80_00760 [endosymbiont of Galathealinum brachiosum]|uniref:histidine kinase n=1 Tax=endosymbiont of Galathealinum brachiosum TaxID=2200906 RepID=A0A370DNT7_9GAMM|nr:MAG: hypothetical protein DIZ80_00760 [endosymbiont of Galathealinum brachiosum]
MNEIKSKSKASLIEELQAARIKITRLESELSNQSAINNNRQTNVQSKLMHFDVQFQSVIDALPVPCALNDDDQNIVYLNPAFTQVFGYELSDIPTLEDWWPKAYPDEQYRKTVSETWVQHLNKSIETGESFEPIELKIHCKDNTIRNIIASASSITESYQHIHLVTLFDISDRQIARDKLVNTTNLLNNVINSTPDLIFVKDKQLKTILCNQAYSNAVGKTREEMYGNTDIENGWNPELVLGDDVKGVRGYIHDDREALSGKNLHNPNDPANVNGEIRIFDTRKLPLKDSDGDIIGLLGVSRDITERQQAVDALREANAEFSATLKAIPDLLFELDEDGRYLNIWASDEGLLAEQKSFLLGNLVRDVLPEKSANEVYKALKLAAECGVSQGQVLHLALDDGDHWFELSTALKPSKNKLKHFIMLSREVTERINTERQLRRSLKMEALGKLTGGIAHDFNNMLGVVLGYTELLGDSLSDEKHSRYIKSIMQAADRARILTTKLLAFSKQQPSDDKTTSINEILKRDQLMLEKTLTARISLNMNLLESLWDVYIDPELMADAILNICINAMHAMPSGGQLTIETSNLEKQQIVAKRLSLAEGDYVRLVISDTGCGMTDQVKERIFDPFFSTKGEAGTGLGLSQVYGFIQQSKGEIIVHSVENQGTTFELYFPRNAVVNKSVRSSSEGLSEKDITGTETILIVDDESELRSLASDILSMNGYQVLSAESGKTALQILQKESVDLMLTDVIMPEMDGYELSDKVKRLYPGIQILVTSGFNDENQSSRVHTDQQLAKPYKVDVLLAKVRQLLDSR